MGDIAGGTGRNGLGDLDEAAHAVAVAAVVDELAELWSNRSRGVAAMTLSPRIQSAPRSSRLVEGMVEVCPSRRNRRRRRSADSVWGPSCGAVAGFIPRSPAGHMHIAAGGRSRSSSFHSRSRSAMRMWMRRSRLESGSTRS